MAEASRFLARYGTAAVLALLILLNFAITPNFASLQTINVNLTQVCTIVMVGIGMTLVIATGGIDLSVGSLMALTSVTIGFSFAAGLPLPLAILAGIAIGGTIALDALFGGPISGASMNPARSLGPALVSGTWTNQWIYVLGPLIGAVLAVAAYKVMTSASAVPIPQSPTSSE